MLKEIFNRDLKISPSCSRNVKNKNLSLNNKAVGCKAFASKTNNLKNNNVVHSEDTFKKHEKEKKAQSQKLMKKLGF